MKVIFNADDFGLSRGVNLGIVEAYRNGVVRSTTLMAGMSGFNHAVELAKENPGLHIGGHLTLTAGKAVGGIYKTITDEQGNFLKLAVIEKRANAGELDLEEVEKEYVVQIEKILAAGIDITHLDSHHHTHTLKGNVDVFLKLAKKYKKNVRIYDRELLTGEYASIKTADDFVDTFYNETATEGHLKEIIDSHPEGSVEIMCHPAYVDYELAHISSYNVKRTEELHVLTSDAMKKYLAEKKAELCSYSDL